MAETRILVATIYRFNITGLKPGTVHNFFINDVNKNVDVRQVGKNLGDPLISDSQGKLEFDLHIPFLKQVEYANLLKLHHFAAGPMLDGQAGVSSATVRVASADNSSKAQIIARTEVHYSPHPINWNAIPNDRNLDLGRTIIPSTPLFGPEAPSN